MQLRTQIAIRLPADLAEGLALLAQRNGRTRAQEARRALELHLSAAARQEDERRPARGGDVDAPASPEGAERAPA